MGCPCAIRAESRRLEVSRESVGCSSALPHLLMAQDHGALVLPEHSPGAYSGKSAKRKACYALRHRKRSAGAAAATRRRLRRTLRRNDEADPYLGIEVSIALRKSALMRV